MTAPGFRSDARGHMWIGESLGVEVLPLELVDPRFYHLDTCFCPLPGGYLLWYPPAFDADSQAVIRARIPMERRYAVCDKDAAVFACNAVGVGTSAVIISLIAGRIGMPVPCAHASWPFMPRSAKSIRLTAVSPPPRARATTATPVR